MPGRLSKPGKGAVFVPATEFLMMLQGKEQDGNWVITIPKDRIGKDFVLRFLERLELANLLQQSALAEEQAQQLSEELKTGW
jgi:hypothetical protein